MASQTLSGIKPAAQTLGKPAEPVRKIAGKLAAVLLYSIIKFLTFG
ncbi:hypothetical protein KFZ76_01985 [Methylovulum psychrotolerans]|nr:hypothetical protein [Methylovulum psychrotolerans]MBT9096478.1 hypothetical protein [Methylovulum psychrotolerans]